MMRSVRTLLDAARDELQSRARYLPARNVCVTTSAEIRAIGLVLICLTFTVSPNSNTVGAESELDRLNHAWLNVHDCSVRIHAHERLGNRSDDRDLHYAFWKPGQARPDLMSGRKSIGTLVWSGGHDVVAYRPGLLGFIKVRGDHRRFTSLRGNGVLTPALGDIIDCFERNEDRVTERPGPTVEVEPTEEIVLSGPHASCADDSAADGAVARDVVDVSQHGLVFIRQRYEAEQLVEALHLTDYRVNSGLDDYFFK